MKLFYLLAALLCSQYSPITTYAISRQLKEEESFTEALNRLYFDVVFNQYQVAEQILAVKQAITKQPFKPHYKRGGSKFF